MTTKTKSSETKAATGTRKRFARPPADAANAPITPPAAEAPSVAESTVLAEPKARTTKADIVTALLSRPEGATIEQVMAATTWQAHSVRGFLAGTLKKKLGLDLQSAKIDDVRVYKIVSSEVAEQ